jgi:hypothetical protein
MSDDNEDGDTSYNDEKAVIIVPPPAYLRKSKSETLAQLPTLDEQQQATLKSFREKADELAESMGLDELKRAWIDEACLRRYLRARDWKLDDAFVLLKGSLEWRDTKGVWTMREDLEQELSVSWRFFVRI